MSADQTLVPRRVREIAETPGAAAENPAQALSAFRERPAWVLLGEPGAGKTTAFDIEAAAIGAKPIRIADFIEDEPDELFRGKTLFLDGLDEVRAGDKQVIARLRNKLRRLGNPPFRIACRAADWYGSSDRQGLQDASPDGRLATLQLEPLNEADILTLLRDNHGQADPQAFVGKAQRLGVASLLDNPQTLGLLAEAVRGEDWPRTRQETFELACRKLATEANKRHRDLARGQALPEEILLDAAGLLCAVLLLADQTGIALDPDRAGARFVHTNDCLPPDPVAATEAVRSKLFRPEGEERLVPIHRSVAEYLAARWLAKRMDATGLPLRRVLNLLLGEDGRTVAGLRGLHAWLAFHSRKARPRLIAADPLTVVVYGDAKPMTVAEKRDLLEGLRREAQRYVGFRWGVRDRQALGALAAPELHDYFLAVLQAPERDEASLAFLDCVLDVLAEGGRIGTLAGELETLIRSGEYSPSVRQSAMNAWLRWLDDPHAPLVLLDDIRNGRVQDEDDGLAGMLLQHLYPLHLTPAALLSHIHAPKVRNLTGRYTWFVEHQLPSLAPDEHLPELLDGLVEKADALRRQYPPERSIGRTFDSLVARGIAAHGDAIDDDRLFAWLGIGGDEEGEISRKKPARDAISAWLAARPQRYPALLARGYRVCEGHRHPAHCAWNAAARLLDAQPPVSLGLWHLAQVDQTADEELAKHHLGQALDALANQRGAAGLSLETIEAWAAANPDRKHWLEPMLAWEIPESRRKRAATQQARKQQRQLARTQRLQGLQRHEASIEAGAARVDLMHELALVWLDHHAQVGGETPQERFESYCDDGRRVLELAETGFRRCPLRDDLPTVAEIIDLAAKQEEHYIRLPCLVGMELLWREGETSVDRLPADSLRRMVAFRLTYGAEETPAWFTHLVKRQPGLVAEVLAYYAGAMFKTGRENIDSLYPLVNDPDYQAVAILAVPKLLDGFPIRARVAHLHYLEYLLKAALRYSLQPLGALLEAKLALKGMDEAQRVYWYAAAMLLDPERHEAALWKQVGKSEKRANHLAAFLSDEWGRMPEGLQLSPATLARLIERVTPHAQIEHPARARAFWVSAAMQRGHQVRAWIDRLANLASREAERELDRLLTQPALHKLKPYLEAARHALQQRKRESAFRFLQAGEVAQVLAGRAPASDADLAALALDLLDDIAVAIRQDNDDGIRSFWNVENRQPVSQREENLCRDALLTRLRPRLDPLGIDIQPERDHAGDKRADLCLSYLTKYELPIEIKKDSNPELWHALRKQLIGQYASSPRAAGFGIYLVLWFGGKGLPRVIDGGKKPTSPQELQARLEAQLDPVERRSIFVRVLDVSWPK